VEELLSGVVEKFAVEVSSSINLFITFLSIRRYFDVEEGLHDMSTGAPGKAVGPDEVVGSSGDVKVVGNVDEEDDEEEEEWVEMGKHVVSCSVVTSERELANAEANIEEEGNVVSNEVVIGKAVGLDEEEEEEEDEVEEEWVAVANEEEEAIVVSNEVVVDCCF
jgi:hypothetical protein